MEEIYLNDFFSKLKNNLSIIYQNNELNSISTILMEEIFNCTKIQILLNEKIIVNNEQLQKIQKSIDELKQHKPIQQIVGYAYFLNKKFEINENVLIPRQETEELVYYIDNTLNSSQINILDMGTGSGIIAIGLKLLSNNRYITAWDISLEALEIAEKNAEKMSVEVKFEQQDILNIQYKPINFDCIVSNPPYIPKSEVNLLNKNVRNFEPHLALFVEDDNPLLFYQKITVFALNHLHTNGYLFFETHENYANDVYKFLAQKGFESEIKKDLNGKNRMVKAWFRKL